MMLNLYTDASKLFVLPCTAIMLNDDVSGSIKAEAIIADMIRASTPFGMAALAHAQHFRSSPNHSLAAMTSPVSAHDASFSSSTASIDSAGSKRDWAQVRGLHRRQHDINPYVERACTEYV